MSKEKPLRKNVGPLNEEKPSIIPSRPNQPRHIPWSLVLNLDPIRTTTKKS